MAEMLINVHGPCYLINRVNTQNILNKLERELISTATSSSLECMRKRCSDCDKSHSLSHVCPPPEHHSLHATPLCPKTLTPHACHTLHTKSLPTAHSPAKSSPTEQHPFPMDVTNKPLTLFSPRPPPPTPHPPAHIPHFPPPPPPPLLGSVSSF